MPGLPQQTDLAYLAGLIDRSGGFITKPPGFKLLVAPGTATSLGQRFGGRTSGRRWSQTQAASVGYLLAAIAPYVVERRGELEAMRALAAHHAGRVNYHGDEEWRDQRALLVVRVIGARGADAVAGSGRDG